jgi:hypothetical protein
MSALTGANHCTQAAPMAELRPAADYATERCPETGAK